MHNEQRLCKPSLYRSIHQQAHQYIQDSWRTTLCLQYPPHVIAVAAIHLSHLTSGIKLDAIDASGGNLGTKKHIRHGDDKHWWQKAYDDPKLDSKVKREDIISICHQILTVYEKN